MCAAMAAMATEKKNPAEADPPILKRLRVAPIPPAAGAAVDNSRSPDAARRARRQVEAGADQGGRIKSGGSSCCVDSACTAEIGDDGRSGERESIGSGRPEHGISVDMLDLDLGLEADLGVDTVKQAEVFASIREAYNIPRDDNRKLRDYPTLAHVIRFVYDKRPVLAVAPAAKKEEVKPTTSAVAAEKPVPAAASAQVAGGEDVKDRVLALVVEKTGYPKDMLDLDLDLEADLGVDTVKQAEMFAAIREIYSIPRDENRKLRDYPTLAHVIRFVFEKRPDLAKPAKTAAEVPAIATAR